MTTKVTANVADIASQAEAEAGTDDTKLMTPQRTAQAIGALGGQTTGDIAQVNLASGSPTAVTIASGISGAREIHLWLKDVSTNAANTPILLQIGDSGGIETTGYDGNVASMHGGTPSGTNNQDTDGWHIPTDNLLDAAGVIWVTAHLYHLGSNLWFGEVHGILDGVQHVSMALGDKTLSGELTQIQLTTPAGTATFDGGTSQGFYRG